MNDKSNVVSSTQPSATLKRSINLPLLVLYGLGTTIGAGIYVLVGSAAGRAGIYAPVAFLVAAIGVAPSAASYAELAGRYPVSAAEAVYIENGFRSRFMSLLSGLLVIFSGVVAAATITLGCAGYLRDFFDIPVWAAVIGIVLSMGLVAAWGILESVMLAALFTLIEVGGLAILIFAGTMGPDNVLVNMPNVLPPMNNSALWAGIASAGLLAVFAFIGFEDMVNVVEETKKPSITMPWAIMLTLLITTLLYTLVTLVSVLSVSPQELAESEAPLSLVFERLTHQSPAVISVIAIFATLNTILIQFIMASRVLYGMSDRAALPRMFSHINNKTQTPLVATFYIVIITALLALAIPLEKLAEITSMMILFIWALANLALLIVKLRGEPAPSNIYLTPIWVPIFGVVFCGIFISISLLV